MVNRGNSHDVLDVVLSGRLFTGSESHRSNIVSLVPDIYFG